MPQAKELTIFICYRRADTLPDAGRLSDTLRRRFGKDRLFMDVDSLVGGEDWVKAIEEAVAASDVLLVLIGSSWVSAESHSGGRRIHDEFDRVRLEISAALASDKVVIPILFGRARMPTADELPPDLLPLRRRMAIRIDHESFRRDVDLLVRDLRTLERRLAEEAAAEQRRQGWLSSYTHVGVHPSGGSGTRRSMTLHSSRRGRWRNLQSSRDRRSSLSTT